VKRSTAVRRLVEMTDECAGLNERFEVIDSAIRVTALWAYGRILDAESSWGDEPFVRAAAVVTLPEADLPWLARPAEVRWMEQMVRWDKLPVHVVWRSAEAPVWNHFVWRPLLLWDVETGPQGPAIDALRAGADIDALRLPAPTDAELGRRLERECEVSFVALAAAASAYEEKRWRRANHLELADTLWATADGYVSVRTALERHGPPGS
jgi:hypothetical protein